MFNQILYIILQLVALLISVTLHEVAHGYTSYRLGDDTAKLSGRLSLNPFAHINPVGFGLLALLLILSSFTKMGNSGFVMSVLSVMVCFSFATPVPVGGRGLKNPLRDMALIAISGPLTNIIVALVSIILIKYVYVIVAAIQPGSLFALNAYVITLSFFSYLAQLNIGLAVFNLVPVPPLDGSKILYYFLPKKLLYGFVKYERYFTMALMLLLIFGLLDRPLNFVGGWVYNGLNFLVGLLPPR